MNCEHVSNWLDIFVIDEKYSCGSLDFFLEKRKYFWQNFKCNDAKLKTPIHCFYHFLRFFFIKWTTNLSYIYTHNKNRLVLYTKRNNCICKRTTGKWYNNNHIRKRPSHLQRTNSSVKVLIDCNQRTQARMPIKKKTIHFDALLGGFVVYEFHKIFEWNSAIFWLWANESNICVKQCHSYSKAT